MLKHIELIEKLDREQKFKLLTDMKNFCNLQIEDFPMVKVANTSEVKGKYDVELPYITSVANSWDDSLIEEYYSMVGEFAKDEGNSFLVTNDATILNQSVKSNKISEDGVLTGNVLNAYVNGLAYKGVVPIIGNYFITDEELPYLDIKFNERVARDTYLKAFQRLCENDNDFLVLACNSCRNPEYSEVNVNKLTNILKEDFHYKNFIVSFGYSKRRFQNKDFLSFGNEESFDESITDDELDILVDNFLNLIVKDEEEDENQITDSEITDILYRTYLNSTVLMKNENMLPIRYKYDVGIVINHPHEALDVNDFVYQYQNCNTAEFVQNNSSAIGKLENKDLVIIFLNENNGHIANQDALLIKKLHNMAKNVVGVITTSKCIDTSFDKECDALIKIADESDLSIQALMDIIYGKFSPCGKTTITYPYNVNNIDKNYKEIINQKESFGECTGYRYYDKIGENVKYPFGHGLTYSAFEFSDFSCSKEEISFTVKNTGVYPASDIVQVYLGIENSLIPRAEKKLYSYIKVTLRPNEIRKYKVKFTKEAFMNYDANSETYNFEKGIYGIYVNTSLNENKLRGRVLVDGVQFLPLKGEKGFKVTAHNVVDASIDAEKKNKKKKHKGKGNYHVALTVLLVLTGIISLIVSILGFTNSDLVTGLLAIVLFIIDCISLFIYKRRGIYHSQLDQDEEVDEIVANINLEELFSEKEVKENFQDDADIVHVENETEKHINIEYFKNDKIESVFEELSALIESRGIVISNDKLQLLLASIASSKLLLVKNNNQNLFNRLVDVINLYFGNENCLDCEITEAVKEFGVLKNSEEETNNLYKDILYASRNDDHMCFVSLHKANAININYYNELLNDLNFDLKKNAIKVDNKVIVLPKNIWYLFSFENIKEVYTLPNNILSKATVLEIELAEKKPTATNVAFRPMNIYSFNNLKNNIRNELSIVEDNYKKFDMLESFVDKQVKFEIDNKLNIAAEEVVSILLALGKKENEAIDGVLLVKLLPIIYGLLNGKETDDTSLYAELDSLFGEENLEQTLKMLDSIKKKGG